LRIQWALATLWLSAMDRPNAFRFRKKRMPNITEPQTSNKRRCVRFDERLHP
jgi:hypothetical protein